MLGAFLVKGGGSVFHGTAHVVAAYHLTIFSPGVIDSGNAGAEELYHFGGESENFPGNAGIFFFNKITYFLSFIAVFNYCKIAYANKKQVGRMGKIHFPVIGSGAVGVFLLRDQ